MKTPLIALSFLVGLVCFVTSRLTGQTQIKFYSGPIQSTLVNMDTTVAFRARRSHAYGIDVSRYVAHPIYVALGVQYLTQGAKRVELSDPEDPQSKVEAHYISENLNLPMMLGLSAVKAPFMSLSLEFAFTTTIAMASVRQEEVNRFKSSNNLFKSISYNYRIAIPLRINIKDRTALFMRPYYARQINSNAFDFKNELLGVDLGLSIRLGQTPYCY